MPDDQKATWHNVIHDTLYDLPLLFEIEVDEDVPEKGHLKETQAWIKLAEIGVGESDALTKPSVDPEHSFVLALSLQAIPLEVILGDGHAPLHGVEALSGPFHDPCADVGSLDIPFCAGQTIREDHCDAVGFFSGGAGGTPDPEGEGYGPEALKVILEHLEVFGLPEERGFVGGDQINGRLKLDALGRIPENLVVLGKGVDAAIPEP
jgi:hypothetical protein